MIVIQYRSSDNDEISLTEPVYFTQQKVTILNRDLVFYEFFKTISVIDSCQLCAGYVESIAVDSPCIRTAVCGIVRPFE